MQLYKRETFAENQRKEALLFARKVKSRPKFTQALQSDGTVRLVYVVEYIPQEAES